MKTIREQVEEVMNSKGSKQTKGLSLIKLGLTKFEVNMLLGSIPVIPSKRGFNANLLTFGIEIECFNILRDSLIENATRKNVNIQSQGYNHADSKEFFKIVSDCSIQGENANEVVSPILKGKSGENSLKMVCDSLNECGAKVNKSTGLHVHFDASKISDDHFVRIFKNYQKIERIIDSFMPQSRRENNNRFCKSLAGSNFNNCETKGEVISYLGSRYYKVNAEAYLRHKTVEFRQHSGTTEYDKIINWVNFLRRLINFSFDKEIQECTNIETIPFLTNEEKVFFINRRTQLN